MDGMAEFSNWFMQFILNAFFSVDTFFYMSGLLASFMWFKGYYQNPKKQMSGMAWTLFYLHRIIRQVRIAKSLVQLRFAPSV